MVICILGAITSLALLSVDFEKCWDLAESLAKLRKEKKVG